MQFQTNGRISRNVHIKQSATSLVSPPKFAVDQRWADDLLKRQRRTTELPTTRKFTVLIVSTEGGQSVWSALTSDIGATDKFAMTPLKHLSISIREVELQFHA